MTYNNEHVTEVPEKKKQKILSYICFETAEAFEQWQKDNVDIGVVNISPIVTGINFEFSEEYKGTNAGATTKAGTFVTYWKYI